jgi:ribosomal protein S18 acetylase RimI-like enzyme
MEFKEAELKGTINDILKIAKVSFTGFYDKERIFQRLKGKKYWIYVAKDKGKIVGFKIWYEDSPKKIYSWLGAVHPDYRRKGISTKLMKIQFNQAKKLGYQIVEVKTHKGHSEMISLLNKEGFKETKRDSNHWKESLNKEAIYFEKGI